MLRHKVEVLGHGERKADEMWILNNVVRITLEGIEPKADRNLADRIIAPGLACQGSRARSQ